MKSFIFLLLLCLSSAVLGQNSVSTYTGNGFAGWTDGPVAAAKFDSPTGICRDAWGNLYISDSQNHLIRKISASGMVTTLAGTGNAGYADGPALSAQFNEPFNLCVDPWGNVYVSDFLNQRIRMIDTLGMVHTIAGSGVAGFADGPDTSAQFNYPRGITLDAQGNLFVCDSWNHRIRRIDGQTHEVSTFAGGGSNNGVGSIGDYVDDTASSARFYTPAGLCIDGNENLYVADAFNHRIRKISPQGQVSTYAGGGLTGPGNGSFADGPVFLARLNTPTDVFFTPDGKLLIGDTFSNRVRVVFGDTSLNTLAGNGFQGYLNGPANNSAFNYPRGITTNLAVDSVYVLDFNNHAVRLISGPVVGRASSPETQFRIYPNPAENKVVLSLSGEGEVKVNIMDIQGKVLRTYREAAQGEICELDLKGIQSGLYLLKVFRGNQSEVLRLQVR